MPIDPTRLCPCHGKPMIRRRNGYRCHVKQVTYARRYQHSEKGKARRKATRICYLQSPSGRRNTVRANKRRVWIGRSYFGKSEQAEMINGHVRRRVNEFKSRQQTRAEAESGTPSTVRAEAADRADRLGRGLPATGGRAVEVRQVRPRAARRGRIRHSSGK